MTATWGRTRVYANASWTDKTFRDISRPSRNVRILPDDLPDDLPMIHVCSVKLQACTLRALIDLPTPRLVTDV
jgi:hypothetical protein